MATTPHNRNSDSPPRNGPEFRRAVAKALPADVATVDSVDAAIADAAPDTATTSYAGIVELATSAETTAGLVVQANDTRLADARALLASSLTEASSILATDYVVVVIGGLAKKITVQEILDLLLP